MTREIKVDIVGNSKPFTNALEQATSGITGFKGRMEALGGGSLGKGLAIGAGIQGFNLLTTAIQSVGSQLDVMHQAFLDDEASQQRLGIAVQDNVTNYKDATKAAEDFTQAQIKLGFADNDTRDSIAQLVGQTHDMAETLKLVGLAQDLARAKNIDLATATDVVTKAYNGQARGLASLGVDVQGAKGGTELLARAFANVKGAAVDYATTASGRVSVANAKMDQTMEKVGGAIDKVSQVVIPVMVAGLGGIVDFTGEVIARFQDLVNWINANLIPTLNQLGDLFNKVGGYLGLLNAIGSKAAAFAGLGQLTGAGAGLSIGGGPTVTNLGNGITSTHYGVPLADSGGIVGGSPGSHSLIMAAAGEKLTMPGQGGPNIIINIDSFIGSDRDIDKFADRLAFRLRSTALS